MSPHTVHQMLAQWFLAYVEKGDRPGDKEYFNLPPIIARWLRCKEWATFEDDGAAILTKAGIKEAKRIRIQLKRLKRGILIDDRERSTTFSDWEKIRPITYIKVNSHLIFTRMPGLLLRRKPQGRLHAVCDRVVTLNQIKRLFKDVHHMAGIKQLRPALYQRGSLYGIGLVWFCSNDENVRIPVREEYFDIVLNSWPDAKFYGLKEDKPIRVTAKIGEDETTKIVALIMPVGLGENWRLPKWGTK